MASTQQAWQSPTPQHLSLDAHLEMEKGARTNGETPTTVDTTKGSAPITYRYQPTPPGSEVDPDSPPARQRSIQMDSITESPMTKTLEAAPVAKPPQSTSGFSCQFCQKQFRKRSLLAAHERIHQNLRPFKCDQCPKDFRDFGALSSHKIRLHSREFLKFSCKMCKKRFRYERELEIHQRMHSGTKPYHCGFCNKSFTQLGNQRSHVRRHFVRHGFVKFPTADNAFAAKCVLCNETFNDGVAMEAHTKEHISDEDVYALKEKTTNVLWTTGGSSKMSTKIVQKPPQDQTHGMDASKENAVLTSNVQQPQLSVQQLQQHHQQSQSLGVPTVQQLMAAKAASPGKQNDFQAALTLAVLLGGRRTEPSKQQTIPPKGLPFTDQNIMPPQMATNPIMFPVANHGGASGYYVYVPGPTMDPAAAAAAAAATAGPRPVGL